MAEAYTGNQILVWWLLTSTQNSAFEITRNNRSTGRLQDKFWRIDGYVCMWSYSRTATVFCILESYNLHVSTVLNTIIANNYNLACLTHDSLPCHFIPKPFCSTTNKYLNQHNSRSNQQKGGVVMWPVYGWHWAKDINPILKIHVRMLSVLS